MRIQNRQSNSSGVTRCLDAVNSGTESGTTLQQWDCLNNWSGQQWEVRPVIDGSGDRYTIQRAGLTQCVDVYQSQSANNTTVLQWVCTYNPNQEWRLQRAGSSGTVATYFYVRAHLVSERCLRPLGGSTTAGTKMVIYDYNSTYSSEQWRPQ